MLQGIGSPKRSVYSRHRLEGRPQKQNNKTRGKAGVSIAAEPLKPYGGFYIVRVIDYIVSCFLLNPTWKHCAKELELLKKDGVSVPEGHLDGRALTWARVYIYIYIHTYICRYVCMCIYIYIYVCMCIHIYVYNNICVYMYMYVYIYIYTYIYTHVYLATILYIHDAYLSYLISYYIILCYIILYYVILY